MRPIAAITLVVWSCSELLAQPAKPTCEISGVVTDAAGRPVPGGIVKLFNDDHPQQITSGIGESGEKQGKYKLPAVPCEDKYTLWAERGVFQSERLKFTSLDTATTIDIVMHLEWWRDQRILTAIVLFLYLLSILLFRWHNIAVIDQKLLGAEVAATLVRLDVETAKDAQTKEKAKALEKMLTKAASVFDDFKLRNWFFWTRGDEISSWTLVREVQRQMVCLWPHDSTQRLRARLEIAQQDLIATKKTTALALAELIKETLLLKPPDEDRWKQLLSEALGLIYGANEEEFFGLTIWQSKSTWLAVIACALVQACVAGRGGGILMLMGACGGLLSRLMRALRSTDAPTDYGVSWTTLFLSPVLGAFSGWFGILIVNGFSDLQVLNPSITKLISFDSETLPTLGLAFVLGFSERLFDGLINAVDKTLLKETPGATAPAPTTATAGMSQNGTQTGIKEVKPDKPKAGDHAIIFGAMLDKANVDGIKLVMFGRQDLNLPIVKQDATSIQFLIPPGTPDGKYTLTVMAKNSANVQTSFQVGDDPVPTVAEHSAEPVKPGSTVTFSGAVLDQASVELHDADDKPVEITGLVQSADKIEFTAPATPGAYTLVVTPKKGDPIRRKFTVAA